MNLREFTRFHLLKVLLALVAIQIAVVAVVQNINHRPQARSDQASVIEGRSVKISPLSNDFDKDEKDELAILQVSKPLHGSVEQKGNILIYTSDNGFNGSDSLTYTISDGLKESKSCAITILVNMNLKPLANNDIVEVYCGGNAIIDVLKNDNDREADSIFIVSFSQPVHGKLELSGTQFLYSANNSTNQADSFRYVISDGKSNSDSATVHITIKSKNDPCYPWLSSDIGDAARPGSFSYVNKSFVIQASGADIWTNSDGFYYAYQYINGDCEMYTKVESLEANHEWAKAGIMVRESLNSGSRNAFVCVTNKNGVTCQQRLITNESSDAGNRIPDVKAPYWMKLIRKGNYFSYFVSADGLNWSNLGNAEVPMAKNVYVGFAVTSHNNNEISKAVFSNYGLIGKATNIQRIK
jgi:regulation of enolase protein 1 (concanavalin A-like superfamily)